MEKEPPAVVKTTIGNCELKIGLDSSEASINTNYYIKISCDV